MPSTPWGQAERGAGPVGFLEPRMATAGVRWAVSTQFWPVPSRELIPEFDD